MKDCRFPVLISPRYWPIQSSYGVQALVATAGTMILIPSHPCQVITTEELVWRGPYPPPPPTPTPPPPPTPPHPPTHPPPTPPTPPRQHNKVVGGYILVSLRPSIPRPLCSPYIWLDPFHIYTSCQATSEGVSHVKFLAKFKFLAIFLNL